MDLGRIYRLVSGVSSGVSKMSSNDITGDALRSRLSNDNFNKNWEKIMAEQKKHDKSCASRNKWLPVTPPRRADCDCGATGK